MTRVVTGRSPGMAFELLSGGGSEPWEEMREVCSGQRRGKCRGLVSRECGLFQKLSEAVSSEHGGQRAEPGMALEDR